MGLSRISQKKFDRKHGKYVYQHPEYKRELFIDNFAGGGGASTGIELAIGRSVDAAINHDPAAIAMHEANHPGTVHYCESVWDMDPRVVARGLPVGLVWLSPDCKYFSKAKGGKPVEKSIRGLAWVGVRWAATVKPRVIMLENVEEFKGWGPLIKREDGESYPDPKQKGRTFRSFVNALKRHGYDVEWRELRACDYGAPTIRKRFFLVARCDGRAIVWPEPTHGDPESSAVKSGKLLPWRTAAEIIDWSLPCPSIFTRKKELADNTKRRIARGIMKFVINNPNPFIVKVNHSGDDFRGQTIDEPIQTMTSKNGYGVVTPFIARIGQTKFGGDKMQYPLKDPLTTIVTKAEHLLVSAFLAQYHTETTAGAVRGQEINQPLLTQDTSNRFGLVTAHIARHFGESIGSDMDEPLGTVTAGGGGKSALVAASLVKHYGGGYTGSGNDLNDPLSTVTTVDHNALITSNLVKLRGTNIGQMVTEPLHTITAGGLHHAEVRAFLIAYYGSSVGQDLNEPLGTVTTHERFGLVMIKNILYQIVDIGMRMLEPHELYPAQGFPSTYIISGYQVNGKPVTKSDQVARCGNSVPPPFAKSLVKANMPEHCAGSGNKLVFERYAEAAGQLQLSM